MTELPKNQSEFTKADEAALFLRQRLPAELQKPHVAIICGSGLGGLADAIHDQPRAEYDYPSIPHFPHLTGKFCLAAFLRAGSHTRSVWTCGEVGLRAAGQQNAGCSDGWPCAVSLLRTSMERYASSTNPCQHSYYEGHSINQITFPVRVFKLLGVDTLVGESSSLSAILGIDNLDSDKFRGRPEY
jgi:purine-nucleoside phosphorylase